MTGSRDTVCAMGRLARIGILVAAVVLSVASVAPRKAAQPGQPGYGGSGQPAQQEYCFQSLGRAPQCYSTFYACYQAKQAVAPNVACTPK